MTFPFLGFSNRRAWGRYKRSLPGRMIGPANAGGLFFSDEYGCPCLEKSVGKGNGITFARHVHGGGEVGRWWGWFLCEEVCMSQAMPSHFHLPAASDIMHNPGYQAYQVLHIGFVAAPILAGADKFFHVLVNWDQYLAPVVNRVLGGHGHEFMLAVGVIEIVAGLGVLVKPRIFGYIVAAWL